MTYNHKIFYQGKMIESGDLLNDNIYKVKDNGGYLYNILMEDHTIILVNNMVCETLNPNNPLAKLYTKYDEKYICEYIIKMNKYIMNNDAINLYKFIDTL